MTGVEGWREEREEKLAVKIGRHTDRGRETDRQINRATDR